ncbi:hypothetical protein [Variovorax guangxiensis]|uniref:hypothetical protein n=1 Tax=Variovorax guangxiensis TaxID=1775474 RepID=UPI0038F6BAB2
MGLASASTTQVFLQHQADRLGREMRLRVQPHDFEAVCRMMARGVGVAVIPEDVAKKFLQPLGLAQVNLTDEWHCASAMCSYATRRRCRPMRSPYFGHCKIISAQPLPRPLART